MPSLYTERFQFSDYDWWTSPPDWTIRSDPRSVQVTKLKDGRVGVLLQSLNDDIITMHMNLTLINTDSGKNTYRCRLTSLGHWW